MFKYHYNLKLSPYIYYIVIWLGWMIGWIWVPAHELVGGPLKWIIIAIFAPIGLILLGVPFGYWVDFSRQDRLVVGFFPFIRKIPISKIKNIRKGAVYPMSMWQTSEFVTLEFKRGKPFSFPCNGADEIINIIKSFIEKNI